MAKLLREKYKTYEGARKRAAFENGIALSEFKSGYKARHYRYRVIREVGESDYRVERYEHPTDKLRYHVSGAIERGEAVAIVEKK